MQTSTENYAKKGTSLWEALGSPVRAEHLVSQASWVAVFIAFLTSLVVVLALAKNSWALQQGASLWSLLDVAIYAAIAFGIRRRSRTTAWVGLLWNTTEIMYRLKIGPTINLFGWLWNIAFTLAFAGGVQGTTALAWSKKLETESDAPAERSVA